MHGLKGRVNVVRPIWNVEDEAGAEEDDDTESGMRSTLRILDPMKPSPAEVDEHNKTHLPYGNWCKYFAKGHGKEMAHRKQSEECGMLEVHMDFCFPGDEKEPGETLTVLVAKERKTRMVMASVVPRKTTGKFISDRVVAFMQEVCCV